MSNFLRKRRPNLKNKISKQFFTIDRDLEILKNPTINIYRYYEFLHFLTESDKKLIKEYIERYGKDAYLDFKYEICGQGQKQLRIKKFVGIKPLYQDVNSSNAEVKVEENAKERTNSIERFRHIIRKKRVKKQEEISFPKQISIITEDEISENSNSFQSTASSYKKVKKEKQQMPDKLELSKKLQKQYDSIFIPKQKQIQEKHQLFLSALALKENQTEVLSSENLVQIFQAVSMNYNDFMQVLKGKQYLMWQSNEDDILIKHYKISKLNDNKFFSNSKEGIENLMLYNVLVRYKGLDKVQQRQYFLNLY